MDPRIESEGDNKGRPKGDKKGASAAAEKAGRAGYRKSGAFSRLPSLLSSALTRGPHLRLNVRVPYYVYIVASRRRGTLYVGVTNDLVRRVHEHRCGVVPGFAARYRTRRLVWFEVSDDVRSAIQREKTLKHWLRAWKIALVERTNPGWRDLYDEVAG